MAKIFFSYVSADAKAASVLREALELDGHEVFEFQTNLTAGAQWESEISSALTDADALVVLLSEHSRQSPWIMHEIGTAIGYARERGRPLVVPILFGNHEDIPGPLRSIQVLEARDQNPRAIADQVSVAIERQLGRLRAKEEERKEVQLRVEQTAADYISRSLDQLKLREARYRRIAYFWYALSFLTLGLGAAFGYWRALNVPREGGDWPSLAELAAFGVVVVALLVGLSKLSFSLGKSFMVEALRDADRSHAISFGEFYLKAFGDRANWDEVKEVFQHWNLAKGSTFLSQETKEYDPVLLEKAIELVKAIRGSK